MPLNNSLLSNAFWISSIKVYIAVLHFFSSKPIWAWDIMLCLLKKVIALLYINISRIFEKTCKIEIGL
jgi:hypothetical protein